MIATLCPTCGRPMHMRAGVALPPRKAELFDAIKASGDIGRSSYELALMLWPNPKEGTHNVVRQHIWHLNDRYLVDTSWVIKCDGRGHNARWYLVRRAKKQTQNPKNSTRVNRQ